MRNVRNVTFTQRREDHRVSSRGRGTSGRGDRARMQPTRMPPRMDIPPVRPGVQERLCQKVANRAAAADKAKSDADEASVGARAD